MGTTNYFVVESNGLCFVCLKGTGTSGEILDPNLNPSIRSIYSLQSLSRFLRMDMGKVFKEQAAVAQELLTKVRKSVLKVELCQACSKLIDEFSQLYQQLETTRVRVMASLNNIHGKFMEANENKTTGELIEFIQQHSMTNSMTGEVKVKLDILEVLRTEAIQKGNLKINRNIPRIRVENLTPKKVCNKKVKLKQSSLYMASQADHSDLQLGNIKVEYQIGNSKCDERDDASTYSDEFGMQDEDPTCSEVDEMGSNNADQQFSDSQLILSTCQVPRTPSNPIDITATGLTKVGEPILKQKKRIFKCQICSRVFKNVFNLKIHLDSIHLKIKYKCMLCSKTFSQKGTYADHYKSIHKGNQGLRCPVCYMQFSRMFNLRRHQRLKNCVVGKAPPIHVCQCKLCGKGFAKLQYLKRHMDEIHLRSKRSTCDLCKRVFNRLGNLREHNKICTRKTKGI